jgi:hypothetical protein
MINPYTIIIGILIIMCGSKRYFFSKLLLWAYPANAYVLFSVCQGTGEDGHHYCLAMHVYMDNKNIQI